MHINTTATKLKKGLNTRGIEDVFPRLTGSFKTTNPRVYLAKNTQQLSGQMELWSTLRGYKPIQTMLTASY